MSIQSAARGTVAAIGLAALATAGFGAASERHNGVGAMAQEAIGLNYRVGSKVAGGIYDATIGAASEYSTNLRNAQRNFETDATTTGIAALVPLVAAGIGYGVYRARRRH